MVDSTEELNAIGPTLASAGAIVARCSPIEILVSIGAFKKRSGSISTLNAKLDSDTMIGMLAPHGRLHLVGAMLERTPVAAFMLMLQQRSVSGAPTGSPLAIGTMRDFPARHNVASQPEHFSMSDIDQPFNRLAAGNAHYRFALDADC